MTENVARPVVRNIELSELQGGSAGSAEGLLESTNPLHQVKARVQVYVGEAVMTVGELLSAKEHQVVALDRQVDHPVDLLLEGRVIARGQLVAAGDCFAVRITELPIPLKA